MAISARPTCYIITTLAEYQTRFWSPVADDLRRMGGQCVFVSFDDRSSEMLRANGYTVFSVNETVSPAKPDETFAAVGLTNRAYWMAHERVAFGRSDDHAMEEKLARAILTTQTAIVHAQTLGLPVLVQEVGGFLSVIGAYFAAQAKGIVNWFIEPSFFRGRLLFTAGGFVAPRVSSQMPRLSDPAAEAYLDKAIAEGTVVIPQKDKHHYSAAHRKVFNARNVKRLAEKLVDKHLLGKRQEFGFIGGHVSTHIKMIVNSRKLTPHYTALTKLERFVYYPLHVPGDMALTVRSPEYLDQLALIDYIARSLPDGTRLAVKEHPAMIGMVDADRLIAILARHPRLALLHPGTNNYAVMRNAEVVVTVNSKSGAEAGLLGRPVVLLGDAFYRDAPFVIPVDRLSDLGVTLQRVSAGGWSTPSAEAVRCYFLALWPHCLPGELYVTDPDNVKTFASSLAQAVQPSVAHVSTALG